MKKIITLLTLFLTLILISCDNPEPNVPVVDEDDKIALIMEQMEIDNNFEVNVEIKLGEGEPQLVNLKMDGNKSSYEDFNQFEIYENKDGNTVTYSKQGQTWVKSEETTINKESFYSLFKDQMFLLDHTTYVLKDSYLGEFDNFFGQTYEWFNLLELKLTIQNEKVQSITYSLKVESTELKVSMIFSNFNEVNIELPA